MYMHVVLCTFHMYMCVVVHCTCTCNIISHIVFAWEAVKHETDIHPQAEPTQLTLMHREFQNKKDGFKKDL